MANDKALHQVSPEFLEIFHRSGQRLECKRGDFLYQVGDSPKGLFLVEQGLIGLSLIGPSGKEHLLRFFSTHQFFGHRSLISEESYHGSSLCLEASIVWHLHREQMRTVFKDHRALFYEEIATALAVELGRSEGQHVMILESQVLARVAQSLVYLKSLHGTHRWTREEIANFCASTGPTVIRSLGQLEQLGLIKQVGRDIEIIDQQGLLDLRDE